MQKTHCKEMRVEIEKPKAAAADDDCLDGFEQRLEDRARRWTPPPPPQVLSLVGQMGRLPVADAIGDDYEQVPSAVTMLTSRGRFDNRCCSD